MGVWEGRRRRSSWMRRLRGRDQGAYGGEAHERWKGTARSSTMTTNVMPQAVVNAEVRRRSPQLPGNNRMARWPIADVDRQATARFPAHDTYGVPQSRALAVVAHADDAELARFGSLAALAAFGYEAHTVALADGLGSTPGEAKEVGRCPEPARRPRSRMEERRP